MTDGRWEQVVRDLDSLLRQVWLDHPSHPVDASANLRGLGITSSQQISFLHRVETAYDLDWEDVEVPDGALSSLGGLAGIILDRP